MACSVAASSSNSLGWLVGAKVDATRGVRLLRAAERAPLPRPGFEARQTFNPAGFKTLERGATIAIGELVEISRSATLSLNTARGAFKTPRDGLPMGDGQQAWYLRVTGPSLTPGQAPDAAGVALGVSVQEEAFIHTQRERVMGRGQHEIKGKRGTHDEALRNSSRVDEAPQTTK